MLTRRAAIAAACSVWGAFASEPIQVRDLSGKVVEINPGNEITVVTFISTQCPISNDYNDRMISLYNEFHAKGVHFYFVNANATEPDAVVAEHSKSSGFPFPVYKDGNAAVLLDAQATPETFVWDRAGKQIYQGYIDNSRNAARVRDHGLRNAIEAALANKPVTNPRTKAFGCTIKKAHSGS